MKPLPILLICSLFLCCCRYRQAPHPAPAVNVIELGGKFRITLPENHDKKESWTLVTQPDEAVVQHLNDVWHGNEKGIDFNFHAVGKGTAELLFVKRIYNDTLDKVNFVVEITDN